MQCPENRQAEVYKIDLDTVVDGIRELLEGDFKDSFVKKESALLIRTYLKDHPNEK